MGALGDAEAANVLLLGRCSLALAGERLLALRLGGVEAGANLFERLTMNLEAVCETQITGSTIGRSLKRSIAWKQVSHLLMIVYDVSKKQRIATILRD